ncbi:hypothetical protein DFH08DRAFT_805039 [Mycena albidolilacea]|uniref:Uncharacterized protein n=1 Tax=Mycena albidolilacea TaxID=1033008 RepID=A0AAD7ABN3_9AGAR|nr:hypothetical protein DFH08DRAFT_805039 [Mycena albidolilacea]
MRKYLLGLLPTARSDGQLPLSDHIARSPYFEKLHHRGRNVLRRRFRAILPALDANLHTGAWGNGGGWGPDPTGWSNGGGWGHPLTSHPRAYLARVMIYNCLLSLGSNAPPGCLHIDNDAERAWARAADWMGEAVETAWRDVQPVERAWLDAEPITWAELGSRTPDLGDIKAAWEVFFQLRQEQAPDPQPQMPRWDGPRWHLAGDSGCDLPYL